MKSPLSAKHVAQKVTNPSTTTCRILVRKRAPTKLLARPPLISSAEEMENTQTNGEIKELTGLLKKYILNAVKGFYLENKKQCKIGHINVNSIRYKIEPFKEILQENIFDILSRISSIFFLYKKLKLMNPSLICSFLFLDTDCTEKIINIMRVD